MPTTSITTVSGKVINLIDPDPSLIDIEDIAHHLALINRYNGATRVPYSVAQHSVYVAQITGNLEGLLHDAKEYAIGDMTTPVKNALRTLGLSVYDDLDSLWTRYIADRFKLNPATLVLIESVDTALRQDERRSLQGTSDPVYKFNRIQPWGWRKAKRKFLEMYTKITVS
jgi:hypothetical protein